MLFDDDVNLSEYDQDQMIEAFRAVMGNPRWTYVRSLFNKELDD